MNRRQRVFAFEGPDGVGKSTLVAAVEQLLTSADHPVRAVAFPGNIEGTLGAHVYDLHHRPANHGVDRLTPDGLQILHIAAHVDAIQSVIRPHVESGTIVLLDRYWWSTWVYGRVAGIETARLTRMIALEREYWGDLSPQVVFLVERPLTGAPSVPAMCSELVREYDVLAEREREAGEVVRIRNVGELAPVSEVVFRIIVDAVKGLRPKDSVSRS